MLRLFLITVLGVVLSTKSAEACYCSADYKPFCGTDEKTYSNKCELECAQQTNRNLKVKFEGVCAKPYQPEKGGSQGQNQFQGAESKYTPNYVQPPRTYNPYPTTPRPGYYPRLTSTYRPNTNNYYQQSSSQQKYYQPPTQKYYTPPTPAYRPPQQKYYPPPTQTYQTTKQPYYPPPTQRYTTIPPKQYYPPTKQTYYQPPKQTYTTVPPRQTYYQPRPTPKPYYPAKQEDQSWAPTFGGGYQ